MSEIIKINTLSEIDFRCAGTYEIALVKIQSIEPSGKHEKAPYWIGLEGFGSKKFKAWRSRGEGFPDLAVGMSGAAVLAVKREQRQDGTESLCPWLVRFNGDCEPKVSGGKRSYAKPPPIDLALELTKLAVAHAAIGAGELEDCAKMVWNAYQQLTKKVGGS